MAEVKKEAEILKWLQYDFFWLFCFCLASKLFTAYLANLVILLLSWSFPDSSLSEQEKTPT